MKKELVEFFRNQQPGTSDVVLLKHSGQQKFYVGCLYKCSKPEFQLMIQMGRDAPVGPMSTPGLMLKLSVKLFWYSLKGCILNLGRG